MDTKTCGLQAQHAKLLLPSLPPIKDLLAVCKESLKTLVGEYQKTSLDYSYCSPASVGRWYLKAY